MKDILFRENIEECMKREFSHGNFDNLRSEVRIEIAIKIAIEDRILSATIYDSQTSKPLRITSTNSLSGDQLLISQLLLRCNIDFKAI